jgi:anthranilate synthase/aminodeoxychorismate synthase-like glutamine amidotransferase
VLLVVDNYDSFTFNVVQVLEQLGARTDVRSNDGIDLEGIEKLAPEGILLSPGPGTPDQAGITLDVIRRFAGELPLFGICLGHQAIARAYGGGVVRAGRLMHGRTSPIVHQGRGVFAGVPSPFVAARYHSLLVDPATLPPCLEPTAWTTEGELMGLRHRSLELEGVQFHPESFLTEHGATLLAAFVARLPQGGRR